MVCSLPESEIDWNTWLETNYNGYHLEMRRGATFPATWVMHIYDPNNVNKPVYRKRIQSADHNEPYKMLIEAEKWVREQY